MHALKSLVYENTCNRHEDASYFDIMVYAHHRYLLTLSLALRLAPLSQSRVTTS